MKPAVADGLLTMRQVAERLGLHPNTVRRIKPEALPFHRVVERGDRRYRVEDVDAYVAETTARFAP